MHVSLRSLEAGQTAYVAKIQAHDELARRIIDMGLRPGAKITVLGRAPLRDPVALKLQDVTISLRNSEADHIMVEALAIQE